MSSKTDHTDSLKHLIFYRSSKMTRTAENVSQNAQLKKFGCQYPPLVYINPQKVILFELTYLFVFRYFVKKSVIQQLD